MLHLCGRDSNSQRRVKEGRPCNNSQQVIAVTAVRAPTNAAERPRRQQSPTRRARGRIRNYPAKEQCAGVSIADERSEENMRPPAHGPFSLGARPRFFLGPVQKEMGSNPALSPPRESVRRQSREGGRKKFAILPTLPVFCRVFSPPVSFADSPVGTPTKPLALSGRGGAAA